MKEPLETSTALAQAELHGVTSTEHSAFVRLRSPASISAGTTISAQPIGFFSAGMGSVSAALIDPTQLNVGIVIHNNDAISIESPTIRLTAHYGSEGTRIGFSEPSHNRLIFSPDPFAAPGIGAMVLVGTNPITHPHDIINATDPAIQSVSRVHQTFSQIVASSGDELFEDGIESRFASDLSSFLKTYGMAAVAEVESLLRLPSSNAELAVEAAQTLGGILHPETHYYRRRILENMLSSPSVRLRHGAASGLASMDDPLSLASLVVARGREGNAVLRRFLDLVVDQLERTKACLIS